MPFANQILGGQSTLIRPAIKSPNFVTGVSGWTINKDGSAQFNDLDIRGVFNGNDFILNGSGLFIYSGTPAYGNLILALVNEAGTDEFGNEYSGPGIILSPPGGPINEIQIRPDLSAMLFYA